MKVYDITSPEFTDDHWQRYQALLQKLHERYKSYYLDIPWRDYKNAILSNIAKESCYHRAIIIEENRIVGWMLLRAYNFGQPEQMVFSEFDALYDEIPEQLRQGVARKLVEWMEQREIKETFMVTYGKRLMKLAEVWGGRFLNGLNEFVLYRERANRQVLDDWLRTVPHRNRDLRLEFYPETPESCLEDLAELLTETLRDMPEEGDSDMNYKITVEELKKQIIWRRENKMPSYKVILFNEENVPIAVSAVDISLANPRTANQMMTGVRREFRNRGLARWLKAAMFTKLGEEFPQNEKFVTVMRAVNEPMSKINEEMGYVLERKGAEFRIELNKIKKYLES